MTANTTPARRLVEAFGDCAALEAMYTEDVSWRLNHSLAPNISGPHAGGVDLFQLPGPALSVLCSR